MQLNEKLVENPFYKQRDVTIAPVNSDRERSVLTGRAGVYPKMRA